MFCSKCGKEVFDEAVVCPGCGCLLGHKQEQKVKTPVGPKDTTSKNTIAQILLFVSFGLAAFAVMWLFSSIFGAYVYAPSYSRSVFLTIDYDFASLACVLASAAVITGVLSLIFAVYKKEEQWMTTLTILNMIFAIAICCASIFAVSY